MHGSVTIKERNIGKLRINDAVINKKMDFIVNNRNGMRDGD